MMIDISYKPSGSKVSIVGAMFADLLSLDLPPPELWLYFTPVPISWANSNCDMHFNTFRKEKKVNIYMYSYPDQQSIT